MRRFLYVLNVCISVNCILANQLIFSTEQRVFIYDQYLLTQSASQVQRLFETRFLGVKIPSRKLENGVYKGNPRTLVELKRNIRDEININR